MRPIDVATIFSCGFQRKKMKYVKESDHLPKSVNEERMGVPRLMLDITMPFSDLSRALRNPGLAHV
jgi:hypothetical protein